MDSPKTKPIANIIELAKSTISRKHILIIVIGLTSLLFTFIPLTKKFFPANDYSIYTHFAEAVSEGHNPYIMPESYLSSTAPTFMKDGWVDDIPGKVDNKYADYPPLLMYTNSLLFKLHNIKGLYWFYISLYAISCILFCIYAFSPNSNIQCNPYWLLVFMSLNPMVYHLWFSPIEDKIWFLFFMLISLLLRNKHYFLTIALGIFAALKGLGLVIYFFYLVFQLVENKNSKKSLLISTGLFALLFLASHTLWFPDWINAYEWRASRQNWVGHASIFTPLTKLGIYWAGIPKTLTIGAFAALGYAIIKRWVTIEETLLLPVVISIIFNTELGYDRLLVIIFTLLLLSRGKLPIILAYSAGLLAAASTVLEHFTPSFDSALATWIIIWGLIIYLATKTIQEINTRRTRLPQAN